MPFIIYHIEPFSYIILPCRHCYWFTSLLFIATLLYYYLLALGLLSHFSFSRLLPPLFTIIVFIFHHTISSIDMVIITGIVTDMLSSHGHAATILLTLFSPSAINERSYTLPRWLPMKLVYY